MVERNVQVPAGRLSVHDFGAGPPIVLLHANIVDSRAWEPLTPFLLAAGYRVVATGQPQPMDPPAAARLDQLQVPLLAVAGELDFSFAAATARYLAVNAPDARAVVMPGAAHMIGLEAPEELGAAITEFTAPLARWA